MAGILDAGDKVASIVGALVGLAALVVSVIALRRDTQAAARQGRNPDAPPRLGLGPDAADLEPDSPRIGRVQMRVQARRPAIAVGLMAGAILLYALLVEIAERAPILLECLVVWTSAVLAITATTQMFILTRERAGRRLVPGIVSAIFVLVTAFPFYGSWVALLFLTGVIEE